MEEIQIQFLHLSMASLKSSRQDQPLPPLEIMALSLLGERVPMEEIQIQFLHLFQVGLLKSSRQTSAFAALRDDGSVVTWGDNSYGGNSNSVSTSLNGVTEIFSTDYGFAAIKDDGSVVTWGNSYPWRKLKFSFYISQWRY